MERKKRSSPRPRLVRQNTPPRGEKRRVASALVVGVMVGGGIAIMATSSREGPRQVVVEVPRPPSNPSEELTPAKPSHRPEPASRDSSGALQIRKSGRKVQDMPPFAAPRVDPRALRSRSSGSLSPDECEAHRRAIPIHAKALGLVRVAPKAATSPTLLCVIYTYHKHHDLAKVATETWLPRCDGALVLSDANDTFAVAIPHEGPEEYQNIWQKTRANWRYVSEYYFDDFDYFVIGGEDLFVIADNLKAYLASDEIARPNARGEPLFLGRRFKQNGNWDRLFNSGGAGYVLNRPALKLLYDSFDRPFCQPHLRGFWEDVMVATCLKKASNGAVLPYDTRDPDGRERFHPCVPRSPCLDLPHPPPPRRREPPTHPPTAVIGLRRASISPTTSRRGAKTGTPSILSTSRKAPSAAARAPSLTTTSSRISCATWMLSYIAAPHLAPTTPASTFFSFERESTLAGRPAGHLGTVLRAGLPTYYRPIGCIRVSLRAASRALHRCAPSWWVSRDGLRRGGAAHTQAHLRVEGAWEVVRRNAGVLSQGDVSRLVHYVEETLLMYPCGHNVVLYNTETREQEVLNCSTRRDSSVAVDPRHAPVAGVVGRDHGAEHNTEQVRPLRAALRRRRARAGNTWPWPSGPIKRW